MSNSFVFGKHDFKVFDENFKHLKLDKEPVEEEENWRVEHAGKVFFVRKKALEGHLVHILKDPEQTNNLLLVRKFYLHRYSGILSLYTLEENGKEHRVGEVYLTRSGEISGLDIPPHFLTEQVSILDRRRIEELESTGKFNQLGRSPLLQRYPGKVFSYKSHKLSNLLVELEVELARKGGLKRVTATLLPKTTMLFMPKHDWKPIKPGSLDYEKEL